MTTATDPQATPETAQRPNPAPAGAPARRSVLDRLRAKHPGASIASLLFWEFCRLSLAPLVLLLCRTRYFGVTRIPAEGPLLVVANHQSFLDPPLIGFGFAKRQPAFLARSGLFDPPVLGPLLRAIHCSPIKEGGVSDTAGIREVLKRLAERKAVVLFPEGSRCFDGQIQPFKRGVALLLARAKCPVLPVAIIGAFEAWPRQRKWPRALGNRVMVIYGTPIAYDGLAGLDAAVVTDRLEREVRALEAELRLKLSVDRSA